MWGLCHSTALFYGHTSANSGKPACGRRCVNGRRFHPICSTAHTTINAGSHNCGAPKSSRTADTLDAHPRAHGETTEYHQGSRECSHHASALLFCINNVAAGRRNGDMLITAPSSCGFETRSVSFVQLYTPTLRCHTQTCRQCLQAPMSNSVSCSIATLWQQQQPTPALGRLRGSAGWSIPLSEQPSDFWARHHTKCYFGEQGQFNSGNSNLQYPMVEYRYSND